VKLDRLEMQREIVRLDRIRQQMEARAAAEG
jgi:hypothetical protein